MKRLLIFVLCWFISEGVFGQAQSSTIDTITSFYKGLTTKKFYALWYSSSTKNGITIYKINDGEVDKVTYYKYYSTWENMVTCRPCILETYDYQDKLLHIGIRYTDCSVGYEIEYFASGKTKVVRRYKENLTGNWDSIYDRGYCSRKDGEWTYFNEKGQQLYSEYWQDGRFIKQVPEQTETALWTVELTYKGAIVDKQEFTPEQIKEIKITPKFKNSFTTGTNLSIQLQVTAVGYKIAKRIFTIDNFSMIDIKAMVSEAGIPSTEKIRYQLDILNNGNHFLSHWLHIKL